MTAQDAVSILTRRHVVAATLALTLSACTQDGRTHQAEPIASVASALSAPTKLHAFAVDGGSPRPETPVPFGGKMYFAATDGDASQLWVTDGTVAGTVAVTTDPTRTEIHYVTPMADKLYFAASTAAIGSELYASDGTEAGTFLAADIYSNLPKGDPASKPRYLSAVGSTLFFTVDDPVYANDAYAYTTVGGPVQLANNSPAEDVYDFHFYPFNNGALLSSRTSGVDDLGQIWFSDGTPAGTAPLLSGGYQGANPLGRIVVLGTKAYFGAPCPPGDGDCPLFPGTTGLWKTDGTVAGTSVSVPLPSTPYELAVIGPTIYFSAMTQNPCVPDAGIQPQRGCDLELWTSDGSGSASVILDLNPGTASSTPHQLTPFGDKLLFSADDGTGRKWFVTDGTAAGTFALSTSTAGQCAPLVAGATIFFCAVDAAGEEPWTSDGTPAGTSRWADLNPGPVGSMPDGFALYGGKVLFNAFEGTTPGLYVADLGPTAPDGGPEMDAGDAGSGEAGTGDDGGTVADGGSGDGGPLDGGMDSGADAARFDAATPDASAPDGGGSVADGSAPDALAEDATTRRDGDAAAQGRDSGDEDAGSNGGPDDGGCTMTGRSSSSWLTPLVTLFFLALRRRTRRSS